MIDKAGVEHPSDPHPPQPAGRVAGALPQVRKVQGRRAGPPADRIHLGRPVTADVTEPTLEREPRPMTTTDPLDPPTMAVPIVSADGYGTTSPSHAPPPAPPSAVTPSLLVPLADPPAVETWTPPPVTAVTPTLTPWGEALHAALCECDHAGDVIGHGGVNYDAVAEAFAAAAARSRPAGTWVSALGAGSAVSIAAAVLGHDGVIPAVGGSGSPSPGIGMAVLFATALLPGLAAVAHEYLTARHRRTG